MAQNSFKNMYGQEDRIPDPRQAIKMRHTKQDVERMHANRASEIDRMCDAFETHFNVPNMIYHREMEEFAPLFSNENKKKVEEGTMEFDEEVALKELSQKFKEKINNIYGPIHIVDEEGKDVMPPLPPLYMKIQTPKGKGNEAIQIFFNALNRDENTPMGSIQQKKAVQNLRQVLAMSQSAPDIIEKAKEYTRMVQEFNKGTQEEKQQKEEQKKNARVDTNAVDDLLDFD